MEECHQAIADETEAARGLAEIVSEDSVSREEFERVVRVLSLRINGLAELLTAIIASLGTRTILDPAQIQAIVKNAGGSDNGEKLKKALADLQGFEAIRNILKDFEGPLQ